MKKQTVSAVCLMILFFVQCLTPSLFAATVGATSDVSTPEGGWLKIPRIGKNPIKASYVYEYETRALRPRSDNPTMKINWHLAKISIDLFDRIEPYVELGSAQISTRLPVGYLSGVVRDSFAYDPSFAWGFGGKVIIFEKKIFSSQPKGFQIFADGLFRRTRSGLDKYMGQHIADGAFNIKFIEWQAAVGVSQEFKISKNLTVTPYVGGKYSDIDEIDKGVAILSDEAGVEGKGRMQSRRKFGPFVGIDAGIGKCVSIFAEGRFVDEESVSTGVTVRV